MRTEEIKGTAFYTHYKKGGKYIIIDYCELQNEIGIWLPAVIYKNSGARGKKYCRFENEFNEKFEIWKK